MAKYTNIEIAVVKELYATTRSSIIAEKLNVRESRVYQLAYKLGLRKSEEFLKSDDSGRINKLSNAGRRFQFPKGHVPMNKGQKMPQTTYEKVCKTMFKKGNVPANAKESDGVITIRMDKTKRPYKHIRIALGKWKMLHVHIWETTNGKIPKGMIIAFKDKDTMNCNLENLELITRAENMMRNTIHRYPTELKSLIRINNKIKSRINEKQIK